MKWLSLLLALCLMAAMIPATAEEEIVVSAPVDAAVEECEEAELWAEDPAPQECDEADLWTEDIARAQEGVQGAATPRESLCDMEEFQAWLEETRTRAADADHLLGPGGDINNQNLTFILPGESIAVLPDYHLDDPYGDYSIQGGIMAFFFTIYQLDEPVMMTTYDYSTESTLTRTQPPTTLRLTATATETMPVPYGARPGLEEVEEGSVSLVSYTSRYVNETGLTLVLSKDKLGRYTDAGKMLGKGGNPRGTYSFQGKGSVYHGPTVMLFENKYDLALDWSEFDGELYWRDEAPASHMDLLVTRDPQTFVLPNPIRKGYEFTWWFRTEATSRHWRLLLPMKGNQSWTTTDSHGCYTATLTEETTTVTYNPVQFSQLHDFFGSQGPGDVVLVPQFAGSDTECLTLGFDPRGGTVNGKDYYICETKGAARKFSVDIGTIVPVRPGYTFRGWCTDPANPEATRITDTAPENAGAWTQAGHTELYAVWEGGAPVSIAGCKISGVASKATYTGKAIKPKPTVKLSGKTLVKNTDYKVTYKNNKSIGKATVTIKGIGNYTGTVKKTFSIVPKKVALSKLTAGKKKLTVKWKKGAGGAGYQIQYSTKKNFSSKKTVTVTKASTVSKVLKSLKSGKTYYVRIRGYKKVGGKAYVSAWSKALKKKVK